MAGSSTALMVDIGHWVLQLWLAETVRVWCNDTLNDFVALRCTPACLVTCLKCGSVWHCVVVAPAYLFECFLQPCFVFFWGSFMLFLQIKANCYWGKWDWMCDTEGTLKALWLPKLMFLQHLVFPCFPKAEDCMKKCGNYNTCQCRGWKPHKLAMALCHWFNEDNEVHLTSRIDPFAVDQGTKEVCLNQPVVVLPSVMVRWTQGTAKIIRDPAQATCTLSSVNPKEPILNPSWTHPWLLDSLMLLHQLEARSLLWLRFDSSRLQAHQLWCGVQQISVLSTKLVFDRRCSELRIALSSLLKLREHPLNWNLTWVHAGVRVCARTQQGPVRSETSMRGRYAC